MLTAGGLAPCLSSSVGALIHEYDTKYPDVEIICYVNGYKGLLLGDSIPVTADIRSYAEWLHTHGGSPIGNSRVKLTNVKDCVKRGASKRPMHRSPTPLCRPRTYTVDRSAMAASAHPTACACTTVPTVPTSAPARAMVTQASSRRDRTLSVSRPIS